MHRTFFSLYSELFFTEAKTSYTRIIRKRQIKQCIEK